MHYTPTSCVHIAQRSSTSFLGWSDTLQVLGSMRVASGIPRPPTSIERYGELIRVKVGDSGKVSLELGAYNPVCCSHTFVGALISHNTLLEGLWPPGPNQAPHAARWIKMSGDSCISDED